MLVLKGVEGEAVGRVVGGGCCILCSLGWYAKRTAGLSCFIISQMLYNYSFN